jgi:ABC-type protease/lipase transport system fused ATPase/permease subunit
MVSIGVEHPEVSTGRGQTPRPAGFPGVFPAVSAMSGVLNMLALTGSFSMLQIYDRVLTSHSVPTLVALSVLAVGLALFEGLRVAEFVERTGHWRRTVRNQLAEVFAKTGTHRQSELVALIARHLGTGTGTGVEPA